MDLLTYKAEDQAPDAPRNPGRMHRAWHWLLSLTPSAVVLLTALSLGLGEVAYQLDNAWALGIFSVIWLATFLALVGMVARWMTPAHHTAHGRHRMAT